VKAPSLRKKKKKKKKKTKQTHLLAINSKSQNQIHPARCKLSWTVGGKTKKKKKKKKKGKKEEKNKTGPTPGTPRNTQPG